MINNTIDENEKLQCFDLIFLYANPLVSDICDIPIKENIDFEKEINLLRYLFNPKADEIISKPKVIIDIASVHNLYNYLSYKTKIFHLSCHGCYNSIKHKKDINKFDNNQNKEYYLYLEQLGVVNKLAKIDLNNFLTNNHPQLQIDLLFLSVCHSEEIMDLFVKRGVKAIISINSLCEISTDSSLIFSKSFYSHIIQDNQNISDAFEKAKIETSKLFSYEGYNCKCHSHTLTCKYNINQIHDDNENNDLEIEDSRICSCIHLLNNEVTHYESNIHLFNCKYANYLITKYNFIAKIDLLKQIKKICCCSIDIIHNESSKYVLYNTKSFPLNIHTEPSISLQSNMKDRYDFISGIIGRKKLLICAIRKIISTPIRVLLINGERGIGKNCFAHIIFKYCFNRGYFRDGVLSINCSVFNESLLIQEIKSHLHLTDTHNNEDIQNIIYGKLKYKNMVIIIKDNQHYSNSFLKLLLSKTQKLKVIITSIGNTNILYDTNLESIINLKPLDNYYTGELLHYLIQKKFPTNIENPIQSEMLNKLIESSKGIHSIIYQIASQISFNLTLAKEEMVNKKQNHLLN